jgi:hypothetical protein
VPVAVSATPPFVQLAPVTALKVLGAAGETRAAAAARRATRARWPPMRTSAGMAEAIRAGVQ